MHAYVPSRPSCPAHAHTPTHARPQHTGINDRFVYGAASIIRDYIRRRWTRLHASHINDLPLPPILPLLLPALLPLVRLILPLLSRLLQWRLLLQLPLLLLVLPLLRRALLLPRPWPLRISRQQIAGDRGRSRPSAPRRP